MIARRGLLAVLGGLITSVMPLTRTRSASLAPEGAHLSVATEHELYSFHPGGTDRVRCAIMEAKATDNWYVPTNSGQVAIVCQRDAATITRVGKRITIDLS